MKTFLECVPCLVRQAYEAAAFATEAEDLRESIVRDAVRRVADIRLDQTPPHMAVGIHRLVRERTGVADPYHGVKSRSNQAVLALYDRLRERIESSGDPFATAVRLAIVGNVIDFGAPGRPPLDTLMSIVEERLSTPLFGVGIEPLRRAVEEARQILFLADNAGELVFDRLLMEQIGVDKCICAVKGAPVLNDVTRADAKEAGLEGLVTVIDNGSDAPGTVLEWCAAPFVKQFEQADVVIAKGQGNYETLNNAPRPHLFFLLKAKCPVIARHLACQVGDFVIHATTAPA